MKGNDVNWVSAIRGPITLITVGVLFVLNNFTGMGFDKTWPVLLIVFGLLSLLRRSAAAQAPPAPAFPPPNYTYNPPPAPPPAAGSYTGSTYAQPAPPRGGFGASAPAKPETGTGSAPSGEGV
ncbi:MAG: hypothetical protein KGN36_19050 [Acidobacteriota bacterium]|nr:hypothetical protein [Acidobacteriota bacterium]